MTHHPDEIPVDSSPDTEARPGVADDTDARQSLVILSFSNIASDPRVLRQVGAFTPLYDVTTVGYGAAPEGVRRHIEVPREYDSMRPSFRHFMALLALRRFRRTYFRSRKIRFVAEALEPGSMDIILANDAESAPIAALLAPRYGFHCDLHEYATRQRENESWWRTLVAPFVRWMITTSVRRAASVTTVSPGLADEYAREFGITAGVVPNVPPHRVDLAPRPTPTDAPLRVVHAGAATRSRKIHVMLEAVRQANELRPGGFVLDLYLMAGDQPYIRELTEQAAAVTDGSIRVLDAVPFAELLDTMARYDIGLYACPPENFNQLHALPNKLFEFIQARLALVFGPSPDMSEYIRRYGVGVTSDDFSAPSVAESLATLTPAAVDEMKQRSHLAASELTSERQSQGWADAVATLAAHGKGGERR